MGKRRNVRWARIDHGIKNLEDRIEYISNHNDLSQENLDFNKLTTYLFRSTDVESERKIEYSFFRDSAEFFKHSSHRKIADYQEEIGFENMYRSLEGKEKQRVKSVLYPKSSDVIKKVFSITENKDLVSPHDSGFILSDSYVDKLFVEEMGLSERKMCTKHYKEYIDDVISSRVLSQIEFFIESVYMACQNNEEVKAIHLLSNGMSDVEIAEAMGISRLKTTNIIDRVLERV